jgi:hypothetical protein
MKYIQTWTFKESMPYKEISLEIRQCILNYESKTKNDSVLLIHDIFLYCTKSYTT